VNDLLKRFDMGNSKPIKTPMATNAHLDLDEGGNPVDLKLYRSMIDSLPYLTASRPDIFIKPFDLSNVAWNHIFIANCLYHALISLIVSCHCNIHMSLFA
jgi:hypothetical protein